MHKARRGFRPTLIGAAERNDRNNLATVTKRRLSDRKPYQTLRERPNPDRPPLSFAICHSS
jgi:hypothetical protein